MAKPNQSGRYDQKKADPAKDQDQDKDEEGAEKEGPEAEQNKAQNSLGNAALAAQMITSNPGDDGGGGGGGGGLSMRKAAMDQDKDYGGDGVVDDDIPLTLEDLTRSWNPGIPKTQDRPSWLEPMPSDELPPEQAEFLAAIREGDQPVSVAGGFTPDSQLQPSRSVVASSLLDWTRGTHRFGGAGLLDRAIRHATLPPISMLHDPDGRVLLSRARTGAIATWQLLGALTGASTGTIACASFLVELEGHKRHQEAVRIAPGVEGKQMPRATQVFELAYGAPGGRLAPRPLTPSAEQRLLALLDVMFDLEDPHVYVPSLIADEDAPPADDDEDDPLGLDALLADLTGGRPDREAPLYHAAIQAAERLAAATARTRIHVASTAVAVGQVAGLWSAGAPIDALKQALDVVDQQSDKNLRLLVEIARAAQKRAVPPKGLKAGLKRAAKGLQGVHASAARLLAEVVGGILPGQPELPDAPSSPSDPLEDAWLDGEPGHALPWLASLERTPENEATELLTRAAAGHAPAGLGPALLSIADRLPDPHQGEILRVFAGPCLLAAGDVPGALALGGREVQLGIRRRNGLALANGALLGIEALRRAGRVDEAAALRLQAGRSAWQIAAPSALTLLARWRPPEDQDVEAA